VNLTISTGVSPSPIIPLIPEIDLIKVIPKFLVKIVKAHHTWPFKAILSIRKDANPGGLIFFTNFAANLEEALHYGAII
jgi:hypothetical protein